MYGRQIPPRSPREEGDALTRELARWELDGIAREVDALCPGSEPIAPPVGPPWWSSFAAWEGDPSWGHLRLSARAGGHLVSTEWLELNRHRLAAALDELDARATPLEPPK